MPRPRESATVRVRDLTSLIFDYLLRHGYGYGTAAHESAPTLAVMLVAYDEAKHYDMQDAVAQIRNTFYSMAVKNEIKWTDIREILNRNLLPR